MIAAEKFCELIGESWAIVAVDKSGSVEGEEIFLHETDGCVDGLILTQSGPNKARGMALDDENISLEYVNKIHGYDFVRGQDGEVVWG